MFSVGNPWPAVKRKKRRKKEKEKRKETNKKERNDKKTNGEKRNWTVGILLFNLPKIAKEIVPWIRKSGIITTNVFPREGSAKDS